MKEELRRMLGLARTAPAPTEAVQVGEHAADVAKLVAELAASRAREVALADAVQKVEQMVAEADALAHTAKLATRKSTLLAAVGTARGEALYKGAEDMSDAHFAVVMQAVGMAQVKEKADPLFNEAGIEAEADIAKTSGQTAVLDYLKALYAPKQH